MLERDSDESCQAVEPNVSPMEKVIEDSGRMGKVARNLTVQIPDNFDRAMIDSRRDDSEVPEPRSCVPKQRPKFEITAKEATESAQEIERQKPWFKSNSQAISYPENIHLKNNLTISDENEAYILGTNPSQPQIPGWPGKDRGDCQSKSGGGRASQGCSPDRGGVARRFQLNLSQLKQGGNQTKVQKNFQEMIRKKFVFKTFIENVSKKQSLVPCDKAARKPGYLSSRTLQPRLCPKGSPKPLKEIRGVVNAPCGKSRSFNEKPCVQRGGVNEYNFPEIGDSDSADTPGEGTLTEDGQSYSTRTLFY